MNRRLAIFTGVTLAVLFNSSDRAAWAQERLAEEQADDQSGALPQAEPSRAVEEPGEEADAQTVEEQTIERAREHIAVAETLYGADDWDGALVEFQRAYDLLAGHPLQYLLSYNLGRCHEHLFQYGRALVSYRRYLAEAGPDAEDRAEVQARVDLLDQLLATVRLVVDASEYEVWVDDRRIGANRSEIMVPGGSHLIEIRAAGYSPAQQDIQIAAREERTLTFDLERLAEEYRGIHHGYFWASTALAVATLTVGVVLGVTVAVESDRVATQAQDPVEGMTLNQEDLDRIDRLALSADLLYGTAGLFAVAAVVLAFLTDWGGSDARTPAEAGESAMRVRLVAGGGPERASLLLVGSF